MSINREQAIKRLNAIEKETKDLRAIINKNDTDDWTIVVDIESACNRLGNNADEDVWEYKRLVDHNYSKKIINQKALEVCIKALNTTGGRTWVPDFESKTQRKYYPWFERKSHGWVFFVVYHFCDVAGVGSGCFYESEEKAKHGAKYFKPYYDVWFG